MSRRKDRAYWRSEDESEGGDSDRSLLNRLVEAVLTFAVCCFLVKLGVEQILLVRVPLLIIVVCVGIIWITVRTAKWRDRHDDY